MKKSTKKYLLYGAGAYVLLASGLLGGASVQGIRAERDWLIKEVKWRRQGEQELQSILRANGIEFDGWMDTYGSFHPGGYESLPRNHRFLSTDMFSY